ncbi:hypothetical protein HH214_21320 [Mucilaginibacter robiniae]|uniref:D-isomer specific 2-hydroxyacid dehydrogenase NAD-binding domain-containing protein n=1 Tax=Mucilaginibacter robiniae TaxID=2728022 RepID=A0A7L5E5C0_9SPHI|nr:NAD(P)-dependent oxidoreductase [Mucilaginibacter robiniae]QJD98235.1 hypothetical protein HH214_21320 [Mucilaginibacter robiniae]
MLANHRGHRPQRQNRRHHGLGRVGQKLAPYAKAFDMKVIAWSEYLATEKAAEHGAVLVIKKSS